MGCRLCQGTTTSKKHKSLDLFLKIKNLYPEQNGGGDGDFFHNIPFDEFLCPKCEYVPEIIKVHSDNNKIEIKCKKCGTTEIDINEYYTSTKNSHFQYYKIECSKEECNKKYIEENDYVMKKILENEFSNKKFKYCYECKKTLCNDCYKNENYHDKSHRKKCIDINEKTKRCKKHPKESFIYFCKDCETHFCKDVKSKYHKGHDIEKLNDVITNCENEFMEENKDLRQIIMKKNIQLAKIIKLNDALIAKYESNKNNYYYMESLKNIGNSIKEETSRDSIHVECVLHKI